MVDPEGQAEDYIMQEHIWALFVGQREPGKDMKQGSTVHACSFSSSSGYSMQSGLEHGKARGRALIRRPQSMCQRIKIRGAAVDGFRRYVE